MIIYFWLPGPVYVFGYSMMYLMIMRTVLVIWLSYGSLWFYTNYFIPELCILCMYMYVPPNLISHGLYTPRILHGLYISRTIRFIYISGCILALWLKTCVLLFYEHVCICHQWRNKDIQQQKMLQFNSYFFVYNLLQQWLFYWSCMLPNR